MDWSEERCGMEMEIKEFSAIQVMGHLYINRTFLFTLIEVGIPWKILSKIVTYMTYALKKDPFKKTVSHDTDGYDGYNIHFQKCLNFLNLQS